MILKTKQDTDRNGSFVILSFLALVVSVSSFLQIMNSSDNVFTVLYQLLETLLLPFIPIYISIYTFFWIKAGTKFNLLFTTVNTQTKTVTGLVAMVIFLLLFSSPEKTALLLQVLASTLPAVSVFLGLELQRNNVEDSLKISQSRYQIAPGLATAFFRFLENTISGKDNGKVISKSYLEARQDYINDNDIDEDNMNDQIVILFLESDHYKGSVQDIKMIEKNKCRDDQGKMVWCEEHAILRRSLTQQYDPSGNPREGLLNVVRVKTVTEEPRSYSYSNNIINQKTLEKNPEISTDRAYFAPPQEEFISQKSEVQEIKEEKLMMKTSINYIVMAENRPLQALFEMKEDYLSQEDYELQYRLYYEELKKLIQESPITRDVVHLFHYEDNVESKDERRFTQHIKKIIDELKHK